MLVAGYPRKSVLITISVKIKIQEKRLASRSVLHIDTEPMPFTIAFIAKILTECILILTIGLKIKYASCFYINEYHNSDENGIKSVE